MNSDRDPLISGPERWRWPWDRAKDVHIGDRARVSSDAVDRPDGFRLPRIRVGPARDLQRVFGERGAPAAWRVMVVRLAVIAAVAYHAAAGLSWVTGPEDARVTLAFIGKLVPHIGGVDVGHWLALGGAAWSWQPKAAVVGALLLRLVAFNTAARDPIGGIWMAVMALAIDAATWVFVGRNLGGMAYSPAEGAALVTLLKVEAAVLLGLFFLLSPAGRRKLGETDAHFNRG